ncbi:Frataxin, mitochondrial [Galemys pyrenaicus]|uniref:Frataxin, mitochondrial n=1 Tax=Galemys pyrenaicus TaxID=202257 RepID=A0A8J6A3A4_GALPY|nr:Frataxin, mitochondrial [Galemys pyrenaicus]
MWTLGRRAAAGLQSRSAQAGARAPRPAKDVRLYSSPGWRAGSAAACAPHHANVSLHCLNRILNIKKQSVCLINLRTTGTLGDPG